VGSKDPDNPRLVMELVHIPNVTNSKTSGVGKCQTTCSARLSAARLKHLYNPRNLASKSNCYFVIQTMMLKLLDKIKATCHHILLTFLCCITSLFLITAT
jgi:hypothetical protein